MWFLPSGSIFNNTLIPSRPQREVSCRFGPEYAWRVSKGVFYRTREMASATEAAHCRDVGSRQVCVREKRNGLGESQLENLLTEGVPELFTGLKFDGADGDSSLVCQLADAKGFFEVVTGITKSAREERIVNRRYIG